jgi:hypothetical protein
VSLGGLSGNSDRDRCDEIPRPAGESAGLRDDAKQMALGAGIK